MNGKTINGYTLQHQLGIGGMAEVWYAENIIGKKAAVKLLLPKFCNDEAIVARFQNEAKVMVQLDHPNIRQVYDFGSIDGRPCIVMEYLEGDDLKALMKSGRRFTDTELRKWWDQIADALNYTHAEGIVHRDIKPSNLFLDKKGNIKLLDFGIAKIRESISMTQTGAMMGTLMYMSPEQVEDSKHIGPQSDVYSLAVTFVHLLSGKRPYDSDTMSDYQIRKGIVEIPLDLSAVPESWRGFLAPYLAKKPENRPTLRAFEATATPVSSQTAESDDEGTIVNDTPKKPQPSPSPSPHSGPSFRENGTLSPEPKDKPKSKKTLWLGLGIVAVIVAVLVVVLVINNKDGNDTVSREQPFNGSDLTITVNGVSFVMKPVKGGTFQMGSTITEAAGWEGPVHSVTVNSFYMGETEVTQALWKAVMESNPSHFKGDNLPVEQVSWNDCQDFIRKLNSLTNRNFRLPTEAEWEYTARGGKSNGYRYAGSDSIDDVAWYMDNTHDVKTKLPNEFGLYDMSGNVSEWCSDAWYFYDDESAYNPKHEGDSGSHRVIRGGSWLGEWTCWLPVRSIGDPDNRLSDVGFRLVLPQ